MIYAYRSAARRGAPGSALRQRTSAARDAQEHTAAEIQTHFKPRTTGANITEIDEPRRHLGCRVRPRGHSTLSLRILQPRLPSPEQTRVDPFAPTELRYRQSTARLPRKYLQPSCC